jgi:hypothetical protein
LRKHLAYLLGDGGAHVDFDTSITRFPAADLLVTGKVYVRGADLLDGIVVRDVDPIPAGNSRSAAGDRTR